MSSVNFEDSPEIALSGNVISIPFVIEDEETHNVLKETKLFIHICKAEYRPSDDPTFINISLTGVHQDGSYHGTITKELCGEIFRTTNSGNDIETNDQAKVIGKLFPIDEGLLYDEIEEKDDLRLSARQAVPLSHFDVETQEMMESDEDPKDDSIIISIKTGAKIPITVGSIKLGPVDFEEDESLKNEGNLFNWLEILQIQNISMAKEIRDFKVSLETLKYENSQISTAYDVSKQEHKLIVNDLEQKFYQLLNSKKDKIWSLMKEGIPKGHLQGLNQKYTKTEAKLTVINKSDIPNELDAKYRSPTKKRKEVTKRKVVKKGGDCKRRKRKPISDEDEEEEEKSNSVSDEDVKSQTDNDEDVIPPDSDDGDETPISDDDEDDEYDDKSPEYGKQETPPPTKDENENISNFSVKTERSGGISGVEHPKVKLEEDSMVIESSMRKERELLNSTSTEVQQEGSENDSEDGSGREGSDDDLTNQSENDANEIPMETHRETKGKSSEEGSPAYETQNEHKSSNTDQYKTDTQPESTTQGIGGSQDGDLENTHVARPDETQSVLQDETDYSSESDSKPQVSQNEVETDYGSSEDE